jgi:D-alanine-D-alanine ligase
MKVLVLLGGSSNEREVSLRSGAAVAEALESQGHEVSKYDPADGYESLEAYKDKVRCVLPILHGKGGEDGEVQQELERIGMKYLGADVKRSKLCSDKAEFKKAIAKLGITTPKWQVISRNSLKNSALSHQPHVLKAIDGGSTIDTFIAREPENPPYKLDVFERYPTMLLEDLIEGIEITVGILGNNALPILEIIPPPGGEFDYENKYNGASQELYPPPHVTEDKQKEAQKLAEKVHQSLSVRHLSRTDMMIDESGKIYIIELNTMPGLTPQSLYPKEATAAGLSMEKLVEKFLELVLSENR